MDQNQKPPTPAKAPQHADGKPRIPAHLKPLSEPIHSQDGDQATIHVAHPVLVPKGQKGAMTNEEQVAAAVQAAIGQIAGGVAHDFNNILSAISGFTELVRSDIAQNCTSATFDEHKPKLVERLGKVIEATMKARDLTTALHRFARAGKYRDLQIDLHTAAKSVMGELSESADKRITMDLGLSAAASAVVGDPDQLRMMILNVAMNACAAMPEGGTLRLTTENVEIVQGTADKEWPGMPPGKYVKLSISDTGRGMDENTLARAFEPFFKGSHSKGSGLGLPVTLGIVGGHGGDIAIASEEGKGTTVTILLPLSEVQAMESEAAPQSAAPGKAKEHATIMLVDDENDIRELSALFVQSLGHTAVQFQNGKAALDYYTHHAKEVDLVVLDMIMPVLGGKDCFEAMKKVNPDVRVIIASGFAPDADAQAVLGGGALAFLQKPYALAVFNECIQKNLPSA